MKSIILFVAFTLTCLIPVAYADCPTEGFEDIPYSTPTADFDLDDDSGLATHIPTGLTWKRCLEGQTWNAGTKACDDTATTYDWSAALAQAAASTYATHTDWRVPNLNELRSIVEERCHDPLINDTVFPHSPNSYVWSGSPFVGGPNNAWRIDFGNGYALISSKSSTYRVWLVRGGQ